MPETSVMDNVVDNDFRLMAPLVKLQLPTLLVVQLTEPPVEKLPFTLALATLAPVFTSRIVTVTDAVHPK